MDQRSKVVLRVVDQFRTRMQAMLELFGIDDESEYDDPERRLRQMQLLESQSRALKLEASRKLAIPEAVVDKFWKEIALLEDAKYFNALGFRNADEMRSLKRLEESIRASFVRNDYSVGTSQRFIVPVVKNIPYRTQCDLLAMSLGKGPRESLRKAAVTSVAGRIVSVRYDPEFEARYDTERSVVNRPVIDANLYALVGVHGGKDTEQFSVKEEIAYFAKENRLPLTLREATALYTAHPNFLRDENARVVLLGERCGEKYVMLSYDESCELYVGLVSEEEADRRYRPTGMLPHHYHGDEEPLSFGKPSAGAIIRP